MKRTFQMASLALMVSVSTSMAQEPVDLEMVARIREEGLNRSQVMQMFDQFVIVFGPRLTASPACNAAAEWARDKFAEWGLSNSHLETWEFGRGWTLEDFSIEMLKPRYLPIIGYPKAWSPSTRGILTGEPVMLAGLSTEELSEYQGQLRSSIVMTRPIETRFIREDREPPRHDPPRGFADDQDRRQGSARRALAELIRNEKAGVTLEPSRGEHGTMFVLGRDSGNDAVPSVVVAAEHYNTIARLLERGIAVELAVEVKSKFHETDTNGYNVITEIPGTDPLIGDEVVMAGAHLDSWHSSPGAADNADGCAVVMEAARILMELGVKPRRTIRIALWGGEEEGLLGSREYVERHLAGEDNSEARDNFSIYFNLDPGGGPVYGFFLEGNEAIRPIFEAFLQPFEDMGAATLTMEGIGSTDHVPFIRAGVPGFEAIHDYVDYDVRIHHTNMDTYERIREEDLKQASVVMASLLYHCAMRDDKMPRADNR